MAEVDFSLPLRRLARKGRCDGPAARPLSLRRQRLRVDCRLLRVTAPDLDDVREAQAALVALQALLNRSSDSSGRGTAEMPETEDEQEGGARGESAVEKAWRKFQKRVEEDHGWRVRRELGAETLLEPVHPQREVQERFLKALGDLEHCLTVTYHGTGAANLESIKQRGLLVPGHGGVKVVNGSAHGLGIYTAHIGSASLSRGFCDSDTMFVCAVCDTSSAGPDSIEPSPVAFVPSMTHVQSVFPKSFMVQGRKYGNYQLKQESSEVRHVGNAVVVFEERCVVPVFTVKLPKQDTRGTDTSADKALAKPEEPQWELGPQQIGRRRLVVPEAGEELIRFGSRATGRSGNTVWLPALPKNGATAHERLVQRRRCRRSWQHARWKSRAIKQEEALEETLLLE